MLSQQLANQGRDAVGGNAQAFTAFKATRNAIEQNVSTLQGRYGKEPGVSGAIATLGETWAPLASRPGSWWTASRRCWRWPAMPTTSPARYRLQAQLNELVRAMLRLRRPSSQVYSALQQVVVAGSMARRVTEMRAGGSAAATSGDALARDITVFSQVLDGLRNGNEELGITAVRRRRRGRTGAVAAEVGSDEAGRRRDPGQLAPAVRGAVGGHRAGPGSAHMLDDSRKLFDAFSSFGSVSDTRLFPNFWIGVVSGALSLIAIIGFVSTNVRSRSREQELRYQTQVEFNSRNQQAIMRLLDEISSLGEGDLTVKASVTET